MGGGRDDVKERVCAHDCTFLVKLTGYMPQLPGTLQLLAFDLGGSHGLCVAICWQSSLLPR